MAIIERETVAEEPQAIAAKPSKDPTSALPAHVLKRRQLLAQGNNDSSSPETTKANYQVLGNGNIDFRDEGTTTITLAEIASHHGYRALNANPGTLVNIGHYHRNYTVTAIHGHRGRGKSWTLQDEPTRNKKGEITEYNFIERAVSQCTNLQETMVKLRAANPNGSVAVALCVDPPIVTSQELLDGRPQAIVLVSDGPLPLDYAPNPKGSAAVSMFSGSKYTHIKGMYSDSYMDRQDGHVESFMKQVNQRAKLPEQEMDIQSGVVFFL